MFWPLLLVMWMAAPSADGHGRLIEPPSRASAWRYGFSTPHNYNDHELYCGGFTRQWVKNGGRCGVCGDPWDAKIPRAHEYGGSFGQGVIVRKYKLGQVITVRVELTANHNGYFEFSVCPNYKNATQDCLDRNILQLTRPQEDVDHRSTRYFPKDGNRVYEMKYRLPKLECPHCLLQWRYIAGNNWGNCPNGTGAVGCGPQEEFRACADVTIGDRQHEEEDVEDNEIPQEGVQDDEKPAPSYTPIASIVISLASFLVICLILFLLYLHYYRIGSKVRVWVAENPLNFVHGEKIKMAQAPPMPPPRGRRPRAPPCGDGMYEVTLKGAA